MYAFALLLVALLGISTANPLPLSHDTNLQIRDEWQPNNTSLVCFFLTSDVNFQGEMQNLCEVGGRCAGELPDGLTSNVASAGPTDGQVCFLYNDVNCTGTRSAPIVYPGFTDLSAVGFAKQAMSWRCWKLCGYIARLSNVSGPSTSTGFATTDGSTTSSVSITTTFTLPVTTLATESTGKVSITTTISVSSQATDSPLTPGPSPFPTAHTTPSRATTTSSSTVSITTTFGTTMATFASESGASTDTVTTSRSSSSKVSITTTFDTIVAQSLVSSSAGAKVLAPVDSSSSTVSITTTFNTADPTFSASPELTTDISITPASSSSFADSTTFDTNTPGFTMSPSPVTITHTYADGSTTVETTEIFEPVPTVPTAA